MGASGLRAAFSPGSRGVASPVRACLQRPRGCRCRGPRIARLPPPASGGSAKRKSAAGANGRPDPIFIPNGTTPAPTDPADDAPFVEIRVLKPGELHEAAAILARGMHDNPLHVRVFGPAPGQRARRLSRVLGHLAGYVQSNGELLGAFVCGQLVGVLGMMKPGRCRPAPKDRLRLARAVMAGNSPATALRIGRWLSAWARNDPVGAHWHIGPFAVSPAYRRRGIGRRLMMRCGARIDARADTAYLETDLASNAGFYEAFGFVVTRHESVLGVPNWFMLRPPSHRSPVDLAAAPEG